MKQLRLVDVFENIASMVGGGAVNECNPSVSFVQDEDFEALEDKATFSRSHSEALAEQ